MKQGLNGSRRGGQPPGFTGATAAGLATGLAVGSEAVTLPEPAAAVGAAAGVVVGGAWAIGERFLRS